MNLKKTRIHKLFFDFMRQQKDIPIVSIFFGIIISTLFALINQISLIFVEYNYRNKLAENDKKQYRHIDHRSLSIIHVIVQTFALLLCLALTSYIRSYFRRRNIKFVEHRFIDAIGIIFGAFIVIIFMYFIIPYEN